MNNYSTGKASKGINTNMVDLIQSPSNYLKENSLIKEKVSKGNLYTGLAYTKNLAESADKNVPKDIIKQSGAFDSINEEYNNPIKEDEKTRTRYGSSAMSHTIGSSGQGFFQKKKMSAKVISKLNLPVYR